MALRFLLATRPAVLSAVLGVVYRTISGHLLTQAGVTRNTGHTGAVTPIQRIAERLGRILQKRGLIERDAENAWLSGDPGQPGALEDLIGHSSPAGSPSAAASLQQQKSKLSVPSIQGVQSRV